MFSCYNANDLQKIFQKNCGKLPEIFQNRFSARPSLAADTAAVVAVTATTNDVRPRWLPRYTALPA